VLLLLLLLLSVLLQCCRSLLFDQEQIAHPWWLRHL